MRHDAMRCDAMMISHPARSVETGRTRCTWAPGQSMGGWVSSLTEHMRAMEATGRAAADLIQRSSNPRPGMPAGGTGDPALRRALGTRLACTHAPAAGTGPASNGAPGPARTACEMPPPGGSRDRGAPRAAWPAVLPQQATRSLPCPWRKTGTSGPPCSLVPLHPARHTTPT